MDDRQLVQLYQQAQCIVLTSVHDDTTEIQRGFPNCSATRLLEGMACGAPGICTNVASLPEIVREVVTGFVVPPGEPASLSAAIDRVVFDTVGEGELERLPQPHPRHRFDLDRGRKRCLELYGVRQLKAAA